MKTFFTLFSISLLVFLFTPTNNAQVFEWAESMRGTVECMSIATDSSGCSYITGRFTGTAYFGPFEVPSSGSYDIFIAKYNEYGNCLWVKKAGGGSEDVGKGIALDNLGNSYITGYFYGTVTFGTFPLTSSGAKDIFIAKYDQTGTCIWAKREGGTTDDAGNAIAVDASGYLYTTGSFQGSVAIANYPLISLGSDDIFIAKYSSSGSGSWAKRMGIGGTSYDIGNAIAVDESGNVFITGNYKYNICIAKFNNSGTLQWSSISTGTGSAGYGIAVISGAIFITGKFSGTENFGTLSLTSTGANDIFIVKFDNLGNCLWAKKAGGISNDYGYGITLDNNENCYITGSFSGASNFGNLPIVSTGTSNIFVAKYDKSGNFVWVKKAGSSGSDNSWSISKLRSEGLFVSGKGSGTFGDYNVFGNGFIAKLIATDFDLKIRNNSTDSLLLQFGLKYQATDGMDIPLGENSLPPLPPTNVFDARFEIPSNPIDYSLADFRSDELTSTIWTVKIQAGDGGYPITIKWDSSALGAGNYFLKDPFTGTIVNVDMKNQSSYLLTNNAISALIIEYNSVITSSSNIDVKAGWNIVSVPLQSDDMSKAFLFPNSTSNLYGFSNNYVIIDTALNAKGYWIRYPNSEIVGVTGKRVESLTIPVQSGWNLIGVYDRDALVTQISTTPQSILTSLFYGFNSNYQTPSVLESGKGYWIRSSSNGVINLNTNKFAKEPEENIVNANWSKIIVKDNLNNEGTLYINENNVNLSIFDLPPVPPQGIFDVRFSTQRMVENLSNAKIIEVNSGTHPLKIKATGGSFKLKDIISGEFLNLILENEEEVIIDNPAITKFQIESLEIPLEFRLNQNYPNPFNPNTIITYQIPVTGNVTLKIFDILGREVRTLVNERQEAGSYSVDFNVKELSSGTYFYKITADNFSQVKKMVVLK